MSKGRIVGPKRVVGLWLYPACSDPVDGNDVCASPPDSKLENSDPFPAVPKDQT